MTIDRDSRLGRLDGLWHRGQEFLGTRYAIMGGAMTWVSNHDLVAAISNSGGFGVVATGAMKPEELDAEVATTFDLTEKPSIADFGNAGRFSAAMISPAVTLSRACERGTDSSSVMTSPRFCNRMSRASVGGMTLKNSGIIREIPWRSASIIPLSVSGFQRMFLG